MVAYTNSYGTHLAALEHLARRMHGLNITASCGSSPGPASQSPVKAQAADTLRPRAEIREGKERYELELELPGVLADDLSVQVDRGELTVEATRFLGPAVDGQERPRRVYQRAFALPESVDPEQIGANLENGVLTLTLGKRTEAAVRKIKVN